MRIAVFLVLAAASFARAGEPVTTESLLKELADPNAIARFPDPPFRALQSSSYDRATKTPDDAKGWFANDDNGKFIRVDERGGRKESVMLDAEGPGAVVRIWSPNPKGVMRIYLDGADQPVVEAPMIELLDGTTFFGDAKNGFPLAGSRARGWNLFVPIPFAKRCVITTDDGGGVYYQINWRDYTDDVKVASFALANLERMDPRILKSQFPIGVIVGGSTPPLEAGKTVTLVEVHGKSGVIENICFSLSEPCDDAMLARLVLVGEFDGETTVWCPLADLLSMPLRSKQFVDRRRGTSGGGGIGLAWPMPFRADAHLQLINLSEHPTAVFWTGTDKPWTWDSRSMHFHATWKRDAKLHTRPMRDYRFVTIEGQGVFAGDSLHVVNSVDAWWGEGDEKIYVDGETFPSHIGTGTEDYYGYGWCCPELFMHPLHSQSVCDGQALGSNWGRTIVSRLRGLDAIPFEKSFRFDMEIWHWVECDMAYAATTFWYAKPGATCDVKPDVEEVRRGRVNPPPVFALPGAIECEAMKITAKSDGLPTAVQGMRSYAANSFSGDRHLWVQGRRVGDFVELAIPVTNQGPVRLELRATKSWDYGIVQFAVNGKDVGKPIDLFSGEKGKAMPSGPIDLGVQVPKDHVITIRATVVGGNEHAEGTRAFFGLDAVVLTLEPAG